MATEPTLTAAAENAYKNMYVQFQASNFGAALTAFAADTYLQFNDTANLDDHPPANWCAIIQAFANLLPLGAQQTPSQLRQAVDYVYRLCLLVDYLEGQGLVTTAQANATLAAYNAHF